MADADRADGLPPGWKAVPSKSRPGEFSYVNVHTNEKIAWKPDIAAVPEVGPEPGFYLPPPPGCMELALTHARQDLQRMEAREQDLEDKISMLADHIAKLEERLGRPSAAPAAAPAAAPEAPPATTAASSRGKRHSSWHDGKMRASLPKGAFARPARAPRPSLASLVRDFEAREAVLLGQVQASIDRELAGEGPTLDDDARTLCRAATVYKLSLGEVRAAHGYGREQQGNDARRSSAEHLIATKALRLHGYGLDAHCRR